MKLKRIAKGKISLLEKQLNGSKIDFDAWKNDCKEYVSEYFPSSKEKIIKEIQDIKFRIEGSSATQEAQQDAFNDGKNKAKKILIDLNQIIETNGIEKVSPSNDKFFGKINKISFFWSVVISVATAFYLIGSWSKSISYDKDKNELNTQNIKLREKYTEAKKIIELKNKLLKTKNDSIKMLLKKHEKAQLPKK